MCVGCVDVLAKEASAGHRFENQTERTQLSSQLVFLPKPGLDTY